MAAAAASSRSSSKPNVSHASGVQAIGVFSSGRSSTESVSSSRSSGHSIAVCETSPSPWRACPSPAEKSAPSTGIGRNRVVPATSSVQSMLPPQRRGGAVGCTPGSGGGMPITPGNGRSSTSRPCGSRPTPASASRLQLRMSVSPSLMPSRSLRGVGQPPAYVAPKAPTRTSSMRTARVWPARAPRTSMGPTSACPPSSSSSRGSNFSPGALCQPESRHEKATASPLSTVRIGARSREKWPCRVRRSSGISCVMCGVVRSRRRAAQAGHADRRACRLRRTPTA